MKRKTLFTSMLLAMALLLAACGDTRTDKEVVIDAFDSFSNTKKLDMSAEFDVNVELEEAIPRVAPYIDVLNNAELGMDLKYDHSTNQGEYNLKIKGEMKPLSFDVNIPFFQDLEAKKMYVKTDSLVENFGVFLPLPENLKGKLVVIDLTEGSEYKIPSDLNTFNNEVQQIYNNLMANKSDEDFKKDGNVYSVSFSEKELVSLAKKFTNIVDESLTEQEVQDIEIKIDTMFEKMDLDHFEIITTIEDNQVVNQEIAISLTVKDEVTGNVKVDLVMKSTINSIGEDVEFTINPENEELITPEELEALF